MPQIYQLPLGALGTNCYIIPGEDSRAVVIDPASAAEVEMFLNTHGLKLGTIIVTHGHYDHFAGAAQLMESTGASLLASAPDEAMYSSAATPMYFHSPDRKIQSMFVFRSNHI